MKTGNRVLVHAIILGLISALTVSVRLALGEHYSRERRKIENQARQRRTKELATSWNALTYTPTAAGIPMDRVLAKIDWRSLKLSELQKTELERRLRDVFTYLQHPTPEEYYRIKTQGLTWRLEREEGLAHLLKQVGWTNDEIEARAPHEVVAAVWQFVQHEDQASEPPRLTAVCLDCVAVATSQTNSVNTILNGKVAKGFTIAQRGYDTGIRYVDSDKDSSEATADRMFVHLSIFARSNVSTNAGPIYLSLSWSERDQSWAPSLMLSDMLLNLEMLF